ncbi:MAG: hypothetical protein H7141_11245 [Burkholderiales bacterium]|nr:hypothetical protein [Bacteroidia bacterium]
MNNTLKIIAFLSFLSFKLFTQEIVLNSYNGTFQVSKLIKKGNRFEYIKVNSKRKLFIHELKVFSYVTEKGDIHLVTDSAIYSRKKKFNKPYSNLKVISVKTFHSLLYDNKIVISEKDFVAILKNYKDNEVQSKFKLYKKNNSIRTGLLALSGCFVTAGLITTLIGLSNSSGRNSYPQEKRNQAAFQTTLGLGLTATGVSFSVCTIIINIKNHKLLRKELLPLYNKKI